MGTFVWLYSPRTNSPHITMNSFAVFATLLAAACAAPQTVVNTVNQGPQTGPATPIIGDAVATPKGFRSLALEGFSEDLNQDGLRLRKMAKNFLIFDSIQFEPRVAGNY